MLFSKEEFELELKRWRNRLVINCPICKGTGSIEKIPTNKTIICECEKRALLNTRLVSSGVPRKYLNEIWNWDGLNNNKEAIEKSKKYAQNFQQNYFSGKGVYLYGRQGRGKSLLESLIARDIVDQLNPDRDSHYRVAFIIFEEFVQISHEARNDINTRKKMNSIIENPDLLIIDNIGSETGSQAYNTKLLEFILRKRDNNSISTIISSNFTPEQLKQNYSDTIHDFVIQNCELVYVEGDNFRQKNQSFSNDFYDEFDELDELEDFDKN